MIIYSFFGEYFGQPDLWIYFHYLPGEGQVRFQRNLGVNTPSRLSVDLYTDKETTGAVRDLTKYNWAILGDDFDEEYVKLVLTPKEYESATYVTIHDDGDTSYFFDIEGNFAKVIGLPEEMADGRDVVDLEGHLVRGVAYLNTQRIPRDFVIANTALGIVKDSVKAV